MSRTQISNGGSEPQGEDHVYLVFVNHYDMQHKVKSLCFCSIRSFLMSLLD